MNWRRPSYPIWGNGRRFCSQLTAWEGGARAPSIGVFHLPRAGGRLPLRVSVLQPATHEVRFFRGPECALIIEDPEDWLPAAAAEFSRLHGLSPAEESIAEGLAKGFDVTAIADSSGLSSHTVRTQLKHIFAKTGLSRQSEIVRHMTIMAATPIRDV